MLILVLTSYGEKVLFEAMNAHGHTKIAPLIIQKQFHPPYLIDTDNPSASVQLDISFSFLKNAKHSYFLSMYLLKSFPDWKDLIISTPNSSFFKALFSQGKGTITFKMIPVTPESSKLIVLENSNTARHIELLQSITAKV